MATAEETLQSLREGNLRFVAGVRTASAAALRYRSPRLVFEHSPKAIVVSCSDARVPAEVLFDQGFGDLFVVRVAGNVAAPSQIGSVEFAVQTFGVDLVVVLGHSFCGAVEATLKALKKPDPGISVNLNAIVDRIRPALEPLVQAAGDLSDDQLLEQAVRANVRASAAQLKRDSQILRDLVTGGQLRIVGGEYSLTTGQVDFFDDG
jgi:carbonic anhydrase